MKNLSTKGLSMSQAQSISNLCNQRAQEMQRELDSYNVSSKSIKIGGETFELEAPYAMPSTVLELLKEKSKLHATQGFLMEAIKEKSDIIQQLESSRFDDSNLVEPERPQYPDLHIANSVGENWGWSQLTASEYNEYLMAEAYAAHLGQFIHKGGKLTQMRKQLADLPAIEWMNVKDGEKTPVKIQKHHTAQQLLATHEQIANEHRTYEQRVNYYKAKVKNLVSDENARIQKENADRAKAYELEEQRINEEYRAAMNTYRSQFIAENSSFNANREKAIKDAAALRISVDPRFQAVIDMFITPEN
jgi:hypothetical protein